MMEKDPKIEIRPIHLFTGTISILSGGQLKNIETKQWLEDDAVYKDESGQYIEVLVDGERAKRDDLPTQAVLWLIEHGYAKA